MDKLYYDYELQVWVKDGIIQNCGHKEDCSNWDNQRKYAGQKIEAAKLKEIII